MTNIKSIIGKYQGQMESTGLLRQPEVMRLSPKVAAMPTSFTKARLALQEYSRASVKVQESPMAVLFEYTLPKLEPLLIELGGERAEKAIGQLCAHGKKMIKEHGIDGSKGHLEELFKDLPDYEEIIKSTVGVKEIIEAYYSKNIKGKHVNFGCLMMKYAKIMLGDKIEAITCDRAGMISIEMSSVCEDEDLAKLTKIKNIMSLYLSDCDKITDKALGYIKVLNNLKNLDLRGRTQITEQGFTHLSSLTNLQILSLSGCDQITDQGFGCLKSLINLQHLNLMGCKQITDTVLGYFQSLTNLRSINLLVCIQITDQGLKHLQSLTNLQELNLVMCNLITDQGLKHFQSLTDLQKLNLAGCNLITDRGLEYLQLLIKLQELNLHECTQITDNGLELLRKAIPRLRVNK